MSGTVPFLIELDEEAPIKSLGLLHRIPGLAKIHFNFDAFDRPKGARRQKAHQLGSDTTPLLAGPSSVGPGERLIQILKDAPGPMTRQEIKAAAGGGVAGKRIIANVSALVTSGKLKKTAPATYDLASRSNGSHASPSKSRTSDTKTAPEKVTGAAIILNALKAANGAPLRRADFAAAFERAGRSPHSVGDQLDKLMKDKVIQSKVRNHYQLA